MHPCHVSLPSQADPSNAGHTHAEVTGAGDAAAHAENAAFRVDGDSPNCVNTCPFAGCRHGCRTGRLETRYSTFSMDTYTVRRDGA
jgi:hypothetical protein